MPKFINISSQVNNQPCWINLEAIAVVYTFDKNRIQVVFLDGTKILLSGRTSAIILDYIKEFSVNVGTNNHSKNKAN